MAGLDFWVGEWRATWDGGADQVFKRMVFSDIGDASFDWRWEFSPDGTSWEQHWAIHYERS